MFFKPQHVHFVGIGGIGMSGLAEVLLDLGYRGERLGPEAVARDGAAGRSRRDRFSKATRRRTSARRQGRGGQLGGARRQSGGRGSAPAGDSR